MLKVGGGGCGGQEKEASAERGGAPCPLEVMKTAGEEEALQRRGSREDEERE